MPYVIKKTKNNGNDMWCVHKEGADGKPMGESMGCSDTHDSAKKHMAALYANEGKSAPEVEELMKSVKMYDEEMPYVPFGVSTLADAMAAMEVQEQVKEISHVLHMFKQVADNISYNVDVKDKKAALKKLADELGSILDDGVVEEDEMKSAEVPETPNPEELMYIKSLGNNRVGGYAVLWGNDVRKDLTGEFFTPKTEELTAIYDTVGKLPFLYHHGLDEIIKTSVLGVVDTLKADSLGLWYEAQLKMAKEYEEYVKKLFGDGKLKTSTQTFPVARRVNEKTGEITRWPIVEITATPTPAEYRMQPIEALKSAFQEVGCNDFACLLKKFGAEEIDGQGAEKARLLVSLESLRLESELLDV